MTLFLACFFALLSAALGFSTWMYYGVVDSMLDDILTLEDENENLMLVIGHQQEAMEKNPSPYTIH